MAAHAKKKTSVTRSANFPIMISALLSAILLIVTVFGTPYVTSWFHKRLSVDNPAEMSNVVAEVQWSVDGTTWSAVNAPIEVSYDQIANVKVRVTYHGISEAYLRVSLFGSFYNSVTKTYLPQQDGFLALTSDSSKWIQSGDGRLYYSSKLPTNPSNKHTVLDGDLLTITADAKKIGSTVSDHQEYTSKLYVIVEAVQPNRIEAHWGMNTMPTVADSET